MQNIFRDHSTPRSLDLKPENLLFRTRAEGADTTTDFGLSRVIDEDKFQLLTDLCGTNQSDNSCLICLNVSIHDPPIFA